MVASLGYDRAQDLVGRYDLLRAGRRQGQDRPGAADHAAGGVPRPRAARPAGGRGAVEARAEAGLVVARPIRMEAKQASPQIAALAPEICAGTHRPQRVPARDRRQRPRARHRAGRGDRPLAHLRRRPRVRTTTCWPASSSTAARSPARASAPSTPTAWRSGSRAAPRTASARRCSAARSRSSRAREPAASGSTARSASPSPTAPSAAGSSSRARPTRASASASPAPTWCSPASPRRTIDDSRGCVVDRANVKGFAFEYMTSGRAIVLGDLGPWACAGMTGGRVYVRHNAFGIDREAIQRRLGEGAKVELKDLDAEGLLDVDDLLGHYAEELRATGQDDEADAHPGPRRRRDQQLPDGHPAEGPGGPEHLDRVELAAEGSGAPPIACWRDRLGRPSRFSVNGADVRRGTDLGPELPRQQVGDRRTSCRRPSSIRSVSVWMRYSAAWRSASTWSIRCSRRSVRSSISADRALELLLASCGRAS